MYVVYQPVVLMLFWIVLFVYVGRNFAKLVSCYNFTLKDTVNSAIVYGNNIAVLNRTSDFELALVPGVYQGIITGLKAVNLLETSLQVTSSHPAMEILDMIALSKQPQGQSDFPKDSLEDDLQLLRLMQEEDALKLSIEGQRRRIYSIEAFVANKLTDGSVDFVDIDGTKDLSLTEVTKLLSTSNASSLLTFENIARRDHMNSLIELENDLIKVRNKINILSSGSMSTNDRTEEASILHLSSPLIDIRFQFRVHSDRNEPLRSQQLSGTWIVKYAVADASWASSYDIHILEPVTARDGYLSCVYNVLLVYKAIVWQYSEEKWQDVALILSTGRPDDLELLHLEHENALESKVFYYEGSNVPINKQQHQLSSSTSSHKDVEHRDRLDRWSAAYALFHPQPPPVAVSEHTAVLSNANKDENEDHSWDDDDDFTFNDANFLQQSKGLEANRARVKTSGAVPLTKSAMNKAKHNRVSMAMSSASKVKTSSIGTAALATKQRVKATTMTTGNASPDALFRIGYTVNISASMHRFTPSLRTSLKRIRTSIENEQQQYNNQRTVNAAKNKRRAAVLPSTTAATRPLDVNLHKVFVDDVEFVANVFAFVYPSMAPLNVVNRLYCRWPENSASSLVASTFAKIFIEVS